jgi:hypothetical protein
VENSGKDDTFHTCNRIVKVVKGNGLCLSPNNRPRTNRRSCHLLVRSYIVVNQSIVRFCWKYVLFLSCEAGKEHPQCFSKYLLFRPLLLKPFDQAAPQNLIKKSEGSFRPNNKNYLWDKLTINVCSLHTYTFCYRILMKLKNPLFSRNSAPTLRGDPKFCLTKNCCVTSVLVYLSHCCLWFCYRFYNFRRIIKVKIFFSVFKYLAAICFSFTAPVFEALLLASCKKSQFHCGCI